MKSALSIILSLAIVLSVAIIPTWAAAYNPSDSYTVSSDTPTCEEAILACGGDLSDVQKVYFQLPAEDPDHPEMNWTNHYNSTDLGLDYCQVCVYWWSGIGSEWPGGTKVQWVGYKAKLVDPENRIYEAAIPADGETANIVWNNGVNGGTDSSAEIFSYAHQLKDSNVEGALSDDYETLPEGSPAPDSMDGCIQIPNNEESSTSVLPNANLHSFDWYVYYGDGCYGSYPEDSPNFRGKHASCLNPEHHHSSEYILGDADSDGAVTVIDVTSIQRTLADISVPSFNETSADVDGNGIDITDATWIQRYLAEFDTPYDIGETVFELPSKVDLRDYDGKIM